MHPPASSAHSPAPEGAGRWQVVLHGRAREAEPAMLDLARSYWYGVYAWWRRMGRADAGALTVACFTRWLRDEPPHPEQPGAGCLREWLRARLAEGLGDAAEPAAAPALALDLEWAEARYAQEPEGGADEIFQRRWALTVLEFAMESLRDEYAVRDELRLFEEMAPLAGFVEDSEERYAAVARRLSLSVGAARKAAYDLRSRHRELLRAFVADTVADADGIDGELRDLLCACGPDAAETPRGPLPAVLKALKPDELYARAMRSVRMTSHGAGLWTPPTEAEVELLFPQFEMLGLLGRGGMGAVYKARQFTLDRLVAIKLLPLEISVDHDFAARFVREARAMARLSHPNIIAVHDFGTTDEGHLYFVMEYIDGVTLGDAVHGAGLSVEDALRLAEQICQALAYAHGKGVVHRDIKPANVMIDAEGRAKVADFGLARVAGGEGGTRGTTLTGTIMGTPDYMAPEQWRGMDVDHRADIYSVGVMLYEMLCREVPKGIFDPVSQRLGCDPRVDAIVSRAMQQSPERRFQSTEEMTGAIKAALRPPPPVTQAIEVRPVPVRALAVRAAAVRQPLIPYQPPRARRHWWVLLAVALGVGGALWYGSRPRPSPTGAVTPATATKAQPFVNSLGMKLIPVPISGGPTREQRVLFGIWETRVQDYAVFAKETQRDWPAAGFPQGPAHPAVYVSWYDAQAFCAWLTARERAAGQIRTGDFYRLPADHEWSCAVGLGDREDANLSPRAKRTGLPDIFPWGTVWPPPHGAANLADEAGHAGRPELTKYLGGYDDGFVWTAPVGSFTVQPSGLYDLSGNVWEWCEDYYDLYDSALEEGKRSRVLRGGSYDYFGREATWSCFRGSNLPANRSGVYGFRVVLSSQAPAAFTAPARSPSPAVAEFHGHRYLFVLERGISWPAAKARAEQMGGHLATVGDAGEHAFLGDYCRPWLPGTNNMAWLGAVRVSATPEGFQWVTGEPFGFTAWGERNPSSKTIGDWLALMHFASGAMSWNDYEVNSPTESLPFYFRGFVVEWDSRQGPPP